MRCADWRVETGHSCFARRCPLNGPTQVLLVQQGCDMRHGQHGYLHESGVRESIWGVLNPRVGWCQDRQDLLHGAVARRMWPRTRAPSPAHPPDQCFALDSPRPIRSFPPDTVSLCTLSVAGQHVQIKPKLDIIYSIRTIPSLLALVQAQHLIRYHALFTSLAVLESFHVVLCVVPANTCMSSTGQISFGLAC